MVQCTSVRKKGTLSRCGAKALNGYMLCGRHAKCKQITFWTNPYERHLHSIVRLQSVIRGWLIRRRLLFAGKGVLRRKDLANDEDLDTCIEAHREHPFTYFSFEENGKTWWFHYPTLWKWCLLKPEPTNPYTKQPLSPDTLERLRKIWAHSFIYKSGIPVESTEFRHRVFGRWNIVSQIFHANGFGHIHPDHCVNYSKRDLFVIMRMIKIDVPLLPNRKDQEICMRALTDIQTKFSNPIQYMLICPYALMVMLMTCKDQYALSFTILSAMYRC